MIKVFDLKSEVLKLLGENRECPSFIRCGKKTFKNDSLYQGIKLEPPETSVKKKKSQSASIERTKS